MGNKFGRVHHARLETNSTAEAVQYLRANFPGVDAYLTGSKDRGVGFAVFIGSRNIAKDDLHAPVGVDDIRIAPVIMGSKSGGIFQIILGAALIVAGGLITGWSFGAASPFGTALASMGLSMVLGGVV